MTDWSSHGRPIETGHARDWSGCSKLKQYDRFKKRVKSFVRRSAKKSERSPQTVTELQPHQVRHIAPTAILMRYEAVRSFEAILSEGHTDPGDPQSSISPTIEQLHALRISGKYLRYTLECFRDILPPQAADLIADVTALQDRLGELHDADVAVGLIKAYMATQGKRRKKGAPGQIGPPPASPYALTAYLAEREETMRRIHADYYPTWAMLQSDEWRAKLAAVLLA